MATRKTRSLKKKSISKQLTQHLISSNLMPVVLVLAVVGILFVLTRMKGIEQDYKHNEIAKKIKVEQIENKELKAYRAQLLSVKRLKSYAKKFKLKEPDEKHIIIIPE